MSFIKIKPLSNSPVKVHELQEARPFKDIRIPRKSIDYFVNLYVTSCTVDELIIGHSPEIRILKNIVYRYEDHESLLTELDIELLVNVMQMNLEERALRYTDYRHDITFDNLSKEFGLDKFLVIPLFFNTRSLI
jgi:hypothetical protein